MKYRGRVLMTLIGIIFILIWDIVYYIEMNLKMDVLLNIIFSCILLIVLYWTGGYLDKKTEKIASYKDSKDEMKMINEEMQHVLQSIEEVVFHTDAKGCFQFLNRSWADFSGYSVKESLHKNALHFISLHERHEVLRMIRQHIDQGKPKFKMDFSYQKRDGTQRWGK
ncbi:PAS domain-containing protein [Rossellomorea sp. H39__3]